jgi:hypothetical protein
MKVFFDTRDLIYLKKVRFGDVAGMSVKQQKEYDLVLKAIENGLAIPVICREQPWEWLNDQDTTEANRIAQVLDQAPSVYYLPDHGLVFVLEATAEATRMFNIDVEVPSPLVRVGEANAALHFIAQRVPAMKADWDALGLPDSAERFSDVRGLVRTTAQTKAVSPGPTDVERQWLLQQGIDQTRAGISREKNAPRAAAIDRLRRVEPLGDLLNSIGVANSNLERFWVELDIRNCPAIHLWSEWWWRYASGKTRITLTDPVDIGYLAAYAYSDFALAEKQMVGFVRSANSDCRNRVFSSPADLIRALE